MIELFSRRRWQMTLGERAAVEGILSSLSPEVSLEIGTAHGGSLRSASLHSGHVHSFDLVLPPEATSYPNVTFHQGDSHVTVRPWLERFKAIVQFALIDGDHSVAGALKDIRDVVGSEAMNGIVLVHDASHPRVHRALKRFPWSDHERVRYVDLGFLPGYVLRHGPRRGEIWGGLAMAIVGDPVDVARGWSRASGPMMDMFYDPNAVMRPAAEILGRPRIIARQLRRPRTTLRQARRRLAQAADRDGPLGR